MLVIPSTLAPSNVEKPEGWNVHRFANPFPIESQSQNPFALKTHPVPCTLHRTNNQLCTQGKFSIINVKTHERKSF
jgi:hypothetical protein